MLSDEEREAVEYWKTHMKILHLNTQLASEHYIKVLLNLIEKQQKEIEELKKHKEHEQEYQNGEVFSAKQMYYIEENYIDKDKIKEFIEENTKYISFGEQDTYLQGQRDENDKIMDKLQQLLKERN